jgi:TRAP-type transport system periplasmic protein
LYIQPIPKQILITIPIIIISKFLSLLVTDGKEQRGCVYASKPVESKILNNLGGGEMKKMLRSLVTLLVLALVLVSVIIDGLPPANAADKPIELTFAIWLPAVHSLTRGVAVPWAAAVAERTAGRIKINLFPGSALGKAPDHYDLAVRGAADITIFNPGFTPGRFPLSAVHELPFVTHRSSTSSMAAFEHLKTSPAIQAEFSQTKMYALTQTDPAQLFTVKKPVRTLEDLKGMTIRVPSEVAGQAVKLLGGTPVFMPMTELYQALERNTIDGCMVAIEACQSFRVHEVTKYCTIIDITSITGGVAWNINSWNKLPKDVQTLLEGDELGPSYYPKHFGIEFERMTKVGADLMKQAKVETITLPPAELERWKGRAMPVREAWAKEMEAKGKPAKKTLEDAVRLEEKYFAAAK